MTIKTIFRPRESSEYLTVEVEATVTLEAQVVAIAITAPGDRPTAWHAATWIGGPGTTRSAQVEPSVTDDLGPRRWRIWVRVTDDPEAPVIHAGDLQIT